MSLQPSNEVLNSFNLTATAQPLPGGENNSWRSGGFVLKHVGADTHYEWISHCLADLRPEGFRISKPVKSKYDTYTYNGWTCSQYEEGNFFHGREKEKLDVSRKFHRSVATADLTGYRASDDRWQRAHRIAWCIDSRSSCMNSGNAEYIAILLKHVQQSDIYRTQLVHGDLAGNILFSESLASLILDFSPTLAPVEYAEAILIADSIAWHGASADALRLLPQNDHYREMLLRAVIFRLAVAAQHPEENDLHFNKTLSDFQAVISELIG